jgi:hypothetical protein
VATPRQPALVLRWSMAWTPAAHVSARPENRTRPRGSRVAVSATVRTGSTSGAASVDDGVGGVVGVDVAVGVVVGVGLEVVVGVGLEVVAGGVVGGGAVVVAGMVTVRTGLRLPEVSSVNTVSV